MLIEPFVVEVLLGVSPVGLVEVPLVVTGKVLLTEPADARESEAPSSLQATVNRKVQARPRRFDADMRTAPVKPHDRRICRGEGAFLGV